MKSVHIGVDVSKDKLDVYVPAAKEGARPATTEVDNRIEGFRTIRDLARKAGAIVCLEPTGGEPLGTGPWGACDFGWITAFLCS